MKEDAAGGPDFIPKGLEENEEQLAIQLAKIPFAIVEANAGAAKTTTLARRIAQALHRGAPPETILALTYSQPACIALANALKFIGVDALARRKLRIVTFEDFAARALQKIDGVAVPRYATPEQLKPFVLLAMERVANNPDERFPAELVVSGSGDMVVEQMLRDFTHLKGTMQLSFETDDLAITPSLADDLGREYMTLRVFSAYESERRGGHPDHPRFRGAGDATYDLAKLLLGDDIASIDPHPLASKVNILAVDEMHDMNRAMFTVLKGLLNANRRAVFIGVGDRDQVVHALAGADSRFMGRTFDLEIDRAKRYPLTASYRFGPALAKAAGLISDKPYKSLSKRKTEIALERLHGTDADAAIAQAAKEGTGLGEKSTRSQFAVLVRHPYQSIGLENALLEMDVPYTVVGFDSYLFRPEILLIRGLLAYAKEDFSAINSKQTRAKILLSMLLFGRAKIDTGEGEEVSQTSLKRDATVAIAENPQLIMTFFENQVLRNAAPAAAQRMKSAVEVARSTAPEAGLRTIIKALDPHYLATHALVEAAGIRQVAQNIDALLTFADGYESHDEFFATLNGFELRQEALKAKDSVVLSSVEAAKGLEFDHVVLPNMSIREFAASGNSTEDRNLFYVAITRAKNRLSVYYDPLRPSKYLLDAGWVSPQ